MKENLRLKEFKQPLLRAFGALRFLTMILIFGIIVQTITVSPLLAQEPSKHKVTGKVTAASDDSPIPGASIMVKGSKAGVITNTDGEFSIDVTDNDVLVVSFIGFLSEEVPVAGKSTVDIKLSDDITKLEEIVVIGYGNQPKKDLTGSIATMSSKDIDESVPTTIDQAMQGKLAGVIAIQNTGQPGGSMSIQIRGISTINANSQPLYVIDGVIIGANNGDSRSSVYLSNSGSGFNPLGTINPSEIESIEVLKDASAIAIYGAQASNGVIVITTKRGKEGKTKISYSGYVGTQSLPKQLSLMNLQQYATLTNEKDSIRGFTPNAQFANPKYLGNGTNWQSAMFRQVGMQNHTLSISGGDTKTQFYISGTYFKQDGIAVGSSFDRASLRINLDNKTTPWLKIGTSISLSQTNENIVTTVQNLTNQAITMTPDIPVYNADGSIGGAPVSPGSTSSYLSNPVANAHINTDLSNRRELLGNGYAEITFTKYLSLRNEISAYCDYGKINTFTPTYQINGEPSSPNSGALYITNNYGYSVNDYLTFNKKFFEKLDVNAMIGHEAQEWNYYNLSGSRSNFPSNTITAISTGSTVGESNSGGLGSNSMESYFGRITLGYNDKYLLTANLRNDGSSNFIETNRWVTTYAGAFAWRASSEEFLKNISVLSNLKFRLGYGLTNNANIGSYSYGSTLSLHSTGFGTSAMANNIPNPNLKWETTSGTNGGVDLGLFKDRISLTADVYYRKTDNLLLKSSLPEYAGTDGTGALSSPYVNVGSIENKGFEFSMTTRNFDQSNFKWNTTLTFSLNRNKVLALNSAGTFLTMTADNNTKTTNIIIAGQPMNELYGYIVTGMFNKKSDFYDKSGNPVALPSNNGAPLPISSSGGVWVGDLKFKDINNDGVIDSKDLTYLGDPNPKFQYGINNVFNYKGFDLSIFINGNYGNKILNFNKILYDDPNADNTNLFSNASNYAHIGLLDPNGSKSDINNVYVKNPGTLIPAINNSDLNQNNAVSSKFVEDGSFLRIKNVALGYTIPSKLISRYHISSLRVYANVQNLATFTKYTGYDPEIGTTYQSGAGVDWGRYPISRVWTLGLNISL